MKGCRLGTGLKMRNRAGRRAANLQVLSAANRPPADIFLRIARLKYLPRLMLYAPTILLRLLDATTKMDSSWVKMIIEDIEWLYHRLGENQRPADIKEVIKAIADDPSCSRPEVTIAILRFLRLPQYNAHLQQWP